MQSAVSLVVCVTECHLQNLPGSSVGSRRTQSVATAAAEARPAERQTRSRPTISFAMGTPPPECDILDHFDDAPGIPEMVGSSPFMMPRRSWTRNIERCVISSEKLLREVHALMLAMRHDSANSSAPAAAGSAAQLLGGAPPDSGHLSSWNRQCW